MTLLVALVNLFGIKYAIEAERKAINIAGSRELSLPTINVSWDRNVPIFRATSISGVYVTVINIPDTTWSNVKAAIKLMEKIIYFFTINPP